uniref:Endoplasmic reticulum transmembrane protein n=1 Tax=Phallusia mammillata TaxID=59560 RepID=A0A6F9D6W7_9ASCI|nr:B-cell receptor-associated protein 31-like [Phallusia mammillata]
MSLQWNFVAGFLYAEIICCLLLCIPFISSKRWHYFFSSRLFALFVSYGNMAFMITISILVLLFADAVREVRKYSLPDPQQVNLSNNPNAQDHILMLLFRAQRNLYISGFALFLFLVLRRLILLISGTAKLEAQSEAAIRQAQSATRTAESLMDRDDDSKEDSEVVKEMKTEVEKMKQKLVEARQETKAAQADVEAMKSQAESTNKEYDRLMSELEKLQKQAAEGSVKKDE